MLLNFYISKIKEEKKDFYGRKELLKNDVGSIIDKLNSLINSIDGYFGIYEDLINSYELKKQNYYLLQNINEINKFKNSFLQDINKIIDEKNIINKIYNLIDLYNKINLPNNVYYKIEDYPSKDIIETPNNETEIEKPFYLNDKIPDNSMTNSIINSSEKNDSAAPMMTENIEDNKYKDFDINKMKKITALIDDRLLFKKIFILKDGRIIVAEDGRSYESSYIHKFI